MNDCIFCKIINGEVPSYKIYEDDETFAFLNIHPMSKGHVLIVPKNHAEDLAHGSEGDSVAIMKTLHKIAPKVIEALGATGYNLGMNHGKIAGQEVFHTHLHVIPRYEGGARTFDKNEASEQELNDVKKLILEGIK
ncbi:HIT family protein [Candidatus Uhrbacteria bacterium]|jgi:histidine triad (HIT) family protein|nr:HIT family protein [Candidatus Uhrbacteria bacterium]MBT7717585.1 HIT family protein [Candidatus Uhrbacteria bacterium]